MIDDQDPPVADAAFLRGVLAASADCIKVLDLDGNFVFMNEGGKVVMEVADFAAIRGRPWHALWEGDGRLHALAALDAARAGGTGRFQGPADTLAGTLKWWDVQITPIPGVDGRPERLLAISRDITALVRAERAASMARDRAELEWSRLHETFMQAPAAVCVVRGPEHRFELANPLYLELVGRRDILGKAVREVLPEVEGQGFFELLDGVYASGRAYVGTEVPIALERGGSSGRAPDRRAARRRDHGGAGPGRQHGVHGTPAAGR